MSVTERFCNYRACSRGDYYGLLHYIRGRGKEKRGAPRSSAARQKYSEELRDFSLAVDAITYAHLPESVDGKYALSAENNLSFSLSLSCPPFFLAAAVRPDSVTRDKAPQPENSINRAGGHLYHLLEMSSPATYVSMFPWRLPRLVIVPPPTPKMAGLHLIVI